MLGNILNWIARILSVIMSYLMLLYIFGEGLPDFEDNSPRQTILFIAFSIMLIGLILAWWQEKAGAVVILAGSIGFWLFYTIYAGKLWIHWFFLLFPIIGILFLLAVQFAEPPKKKSKK